MESLSGFWPWPWWSMMVAVNTLSFCAGLYIFRRSLQAVDEERAQYLKVMRVLGLIFVSVALYRSVFVSSYLEQLAWFDSLANSSLLIRGLAFFAELSFAGLFMLAMLQVNKDVPISGDDNASGIQRFFYKKAPYAFFACLFIAQFFATTALVTKFELLFAIEETLWGLAFLLIVPLAVAQLRSVYVQQDNGGNLKMLKAFTVMNASWCLLYCSYSVFYHLPIEYWPHVIENLKTVGVVMNTGAGVLNDAFFVVNESKDFNEWGGIGFMIWHSGYFSVCVWMVLFLMRGPRKLLTQARA
mgnify:CR=1 FL=1